jgi:PST family polysaccharide transporter
MFLLKDFLILTLFSDKFLKIADGLKYQLIAGPLRMITWIISLHMLIKAKPIIFISTELFFGLTLYIFSIVFFSHYGLAGLGYAFLLNNIFSSIVTSMYLINFLRTYHDQ